MISQKWLLTYELPENLSNIQCMCDEGEDAATIDDNYHSVLNGIEDNSG